MLLENCVSRGLPVLVNYDRKQLFGLFGLQQPHFSQEVCVYFVKLPISENASELPTNLELTVVLSRLHFLT